MWLYIIFAASSLALSLFACSYFGSSVGSSALHIGHVIVLLQPRPHAVAVEVVVARKPLRGLLVEVFGADRARAVNRDARDCGEIIDYFFGCWGRGEGGGVARGDGFDEACDSRVRGGLVKAKSAHETYEAKHVVCRGHGGRGGIDKVTVIVVVSGHLKQ
eukprot:CAMPEP_0184709632 /NCGR_PEP_ID=MMETSP0314-20130426/727_1 /TAXON_ID=38298 /ORGANISM="Rhodella maculata, Strain CCMP 736" /LENGTH=159 /DNA_ID=CAMNT_0027171363 /DNA_START=410 /DNA_END=888 /DNA_ORIENTATION=-